MGREGAASRQDFSILRIDLDAIAENYRILKDRLGGAASGVVCGAAVKANAYGLGADQVAPRLFREGCRDFFVATIDEGIALRQTLPDEAARIIILNGLLAGAEADCIAQHLTPALNDPGQIALWQAAGAAAGRQLPAMLHVDTGMNRLGLSARDQARVAAAPDLLDGIAWCGVMSHLASADDPDHPDNEVQRRRFEAIRAKLPAMPASLANSGGIFLGPPWHYDLARPGIALYGGHPQASAQHHGPNPMRQTITLLGRILQTRDLSKGETVGYGGSWRATRACRVATVAAGYADGYLRAAGGKIDVFLGEARLPVIGRISMDLITLDVTAVPPGDAVPGALVELLGARITPDDAARGAGTISYEFLTGLGPRYHRTYVAQKPGA